MFIVAEYLQSESVDVDFIYIRRLLTPNNPCSVNSRELTNFSKTILENGNYGDPLH